MERVYHLIALVFFIGYAYATRVDLSKVKECNGFLDFHPVFDKREEELQFYMQTTAKSEQECIHMCYEKLNFCYTVMYKPRKDDPNADGTCFFGYYRPDSCDGAQQFATSGEVGHSEPIGKPATNAKIYTCIMCKENPPSFIQELDENRVGPAKLIKPADHSNNKPSPTDSSRAPATSSPSSPNHVLLLRESKAFSYLMPKCPNQLQYGVQATLMIRKPRIYAATNETTSIEECAHFCFRQHFCASAFFHNDNCLLSYEDSVCTNSSHVPIGYTGSVFISCIECKK